MNFKSLIAFAALAISFVFAEDKAEEGKPCGCPVKRCPANLALISTDLLINDLCTMIREQQLFGIQTAITNDATLRFEACGLVQAGPFLETFVAPPYVFCNSVSGITSYVTSKGNVVMNGLINTQLGDFSFRAVFRPSADVQCKYLISDLSANAVSCP